MVGEGFIETGVDKLVKLVEGKKRISNSEAAKMLGVSTAVIDEWADFLEEEGIISIEYKLATTYLVERKLSKKEVVKKAKEFHGTKDAFVRKIETAMQGIEPDTTGLDDLKNQFMNLKNEIGKDLENVKEELKELENFERLKKDIDKQMYEQQSEYRKRIDEMEKELFKERSKYKEMIDDIEVEQIKLEEERSQVLTLKDKETKLLTKLEEFKDLINEIRSSIKQEDDRIGVTEDHITYLDKVAAKVKDNIVDQNDKLGPLIEDSKKQEQQILKIQEDVLAKVIEGRKKIKNEIEDGTEIAHKFQHFFEKKSQIDAMFQKVDKDRAELKGELAGLINKAHAFDLAAKSSNVKKYMGELNQKFKDIESKRNNFQSELTKLVGMIKKSF